MKLYTEEQIIEAYKDGYYDCKVGQDSHSDFYQNPNPIELPSDDEIEEKAEDIANEEIFIQGAKWMKEQILKQNK